MVWPDRLVTTSPGLTARPLDMFSQAGIDHRAEIIGRHALPTVGVEPQRREIGIDRESDAFSFPCAFPPAIHHGRRHAPLQRQLYQLIVRRIAYQPAYQRTSLDPLFGRTPGEVKSISPLEQFL